MKRILLLSICFCIAALQAVLAQDAALTFRDARELTITGKVFPQTPKPYERMDFSITGGWEHKDSTLLEMSSGVIVAFRTDSPSIWVKPVFRHLSGTRNSGWAARGFDLYIRKDGKWLWAGVCNYRYDLATENGRVLSLVEHMDDSMKECILYLPTESKLTAGWRRGMNPSAAGSACTAPVSCMASPRVGRDRLCRGIYPVLRDSRSTAWA